MVRAITCVLVALPLVLGACGKKGDPKRPVPATETPVDQPEQQKKQTN